MMDQQRPLRVPPHDRTLLDTLFDRIGPAFLAVFFVFATASVVAWLETEHQKAATVFIASFVVALAGIVVEALRELSQLRHALTEDEAVKACWSERDTVAVLRRYDALAPAESHVKAVWGALAFSNDLPGFMKEQLLHLSQHDYVVERWVDVSQVKYAALIEHVEEAHRVMRDGRYILQLVPDAWFGAMVVDSQAAAINFQVSPSQRGVIGIYGEDPKLAKRVASMINQLDAAGGALRLPTGHARSVTVVELTKQIREYYAHRGLPLKGASRVRARRLLLGARTLRYRDKRD
jgi:hypothetical protein